MLRIARLSLTDYRNYGRLTWDNPGRIVVVTGPNGSGKTNLLEAVSLLVPGRGLRGARLTEITRHGASSGWGVAARLVQDDDSFELGTATDPERPARRLFRIDGAAPRNRDRVAERVSAVWLTPQMDRLFVEGASARRRFLDRLVLALEPSHARELAAHDEAMGQRNRLLGEGRGEPTWLAGLEAAMARHAVAATAARLALVTQLNAYAGQVQGGFPAVRLTLSCPIAARLAAHPALQVEDWLREALVAARAEDARSGGASLGAHRTDMMLHEAETGLAAAIASTGQQKALLIGVVLAHAAVIAGLRGSAPLLLLDEPAVHLDARRRAALFDTIAALPAQILITGTDAEVFEPLAGRAQFLRAGDGKLRPDQGFPPVEAGLEGT